MKERGGCCWFFGGKGGAKIQERRGDEQFPRAFPFTHARITRIYTSTILPWKIILELYSRRKRISLADFALINGKRATTYSFSFHLSPSPPPSFSFFLKKRWKIFHPRLRTVRGPAPSGLTEKCIKGEGDIRKVYMPVVPSLFRLFNDILHGQHFYDAYGLRIKVIVVVVTLLLLTFDFDIDFSFTLYTYVRVCLPKKRMPKEIWRKVSLHEWSWILYIRFGIKQRQHRVPEKIAFSQETGGNRVEGWKLGQRQFLGETISRNEMRKRFVRNDLET